MKVEIKNLDTFAIRVRWGKPSVGTQPDIEDGSIPSFGFDETDIAPGGSQVFEHFVMDVYSLNPAEDYVPDPIDPDAIIVTGGTRTDKYPNRAKDPARGGGDNAGSDD